MTSYRINIEPRFWTDPRYLILRLELGETRAIGQCVQLWGLAQSFWSQGEKLIPESIWKAKKLSNALIESGFAERRSTGIYAKGVVNATRWIKSSQANGEKGGRPRSAIPNDFNGPENLLNLNLNLKEEEIREAVEAVDNPEAKTEPEEVPQLPPLARLWNEKIRGSPLPPVRAVAGKRKASTQARWRENPTQKYWDEVINRVLESSFCTGGNDRGWVADFDFLLRPETHVKVLEGKYDQRTKNAVAKIKPLSLEDLESL